MGKVQEKIAAALAAEVGSRVLWDEPPGLWFLYLRGGEPEMRRVPVPDFIWGIDRPPRVLARMAEGTEEFSGILRSAAPEGLHGAAFRCEAWMVTTGKPGSDRDREVTAASRARRLHVHPDRVESRCMYAVDRAGTTYAAMLARGEVLVKRSVSYRKAGRPDFSGIIPDALDRLVTAVLGVELPARSAR